MTSRTARRLSTASLTVLMLSGPVVSRAQMGGMGQPGGGMPNAPMGQQPKDEGPAQQAPEEPGQPSDLEPIGGYADQNRRRAQLFEIDGYFRLRTDYMHNFNMGQGYTNQPDPTGGSMSSGGLPPFPQPTDCPVPASGVAVGPGNIPNLAQGCGHKDISTATTRLRLEPTLNVTDQVRVRSQIDVLDNTIMGSNPDSLVNVGGPSTFSPQAPIPFLYNTQEPPEIGMNGYTSSIRAKRAWAEVDTEFGSLRFGRMPWHFGRGMSFNDGNCMDCSGGTTVDRIALLTEVYGHQLTLALDYGAQGLTSNQQQLGRRASPDTSPTTASNAQQPGRVNADGSPIDLGQDDDVFEYMFAVTNIDNPIKLRERVERGDAVLNYGLQMVYRSQQSSATNDICATGSPPMQCGTDTSLVPVQAVNAVLFQPSLWAKLYYRALTVEFEGTTILGKMDRGGLLLAPGEEPRRATFRQFGGVLASELHLYRDAFFVGFELGGASGDQAENTQGYLNYRWRSVRQPASDHSIRDFKFSPEYHIDSILFRNILGTVTNAIYLKPAIAYWFDLQETRQLGISGSFVYSLAQVPVATPGNALGYGLEMNVGLNYRNSAEGFYAGMTWGVLWPFAALDRPAAIFMDAASDASAAQVLRGFLGVKF